MYSSCKKPVDLFYDEALETVIMNWEGFSGSASFRESNEEVIEFLKENRAHKILADLRNMKIIKMEDQQWLNKNWFPRIIGCGLQAVAIVESEDFFNRLSVDRISRENKDKVEIRFFKTYLSARNWIRNR